MSKLRMIEEARRKPKALEEREKQKILEILKDVFSNVEEISLAVVHGGFVECKVFRDIDIAVYFSSYPFKEDVLEELRDNLERELNIAIDIQILNYAHPRFIVKVLKNGLILSEKIPGLRAILLIHMIEECVRLSRPRIMKLTQ